MIDFFCHKKVLGVKGLQFNSPRAVFFDPKPSRQRTEGEPVDG